MKLSNNVSKRSILYLFIAMLVSLAVGGYCQTKFTPVDVPKLQQATHISTTIKTQ